MFLKKKKGKKKEEKTYQDFWVTDKLPLSVMGNVLWPWLLFLTDGSERRERTGTDRETQHQTSASTETRCVHVRHLKGERCVWRCAYVM